MHKKTILPNGLRILTIPMANTKTVTVLVLVATGSKYETKEINGISHFLEHMTFKGTKKRPTPLEIAEPLDRIGGQYNAFTGQEYTGYYAKANSRHLNLLLDIISDITLNPAFEQQEINKERGVITEEINMYEDNPIRKIEDIWTDLLYGDQPAGWDTAGKKEVIAKLMRDDFVRYYSDHYVASKTIIVVAGAVKHNIVVGKIKNLFQAISVEKGKGKISVKEFQKNPEIKVFYKKTDQTHIALGVRSYNIWDERRYAISVLATILGGGMSSRLFELLRGKMGAAYYVRTVADQTTDTGDFATWVGVNHRKVTESIKMILNEYKKVKQTKITDRELKKAKDHIEGGLVIGIETSDEMASFYGFQEILKNEITRPEKMIQKIQAVTVKDIMDVACDIFKPEKLNLAVIGPVKDKKLFANLLKI